MFSMCLPLGTLGLTNLITLGGKITGSVDEGKAKDITSLDISKAFSMVSHPDQDVTVKLGKRNLAGQSDCKGLMVHTLSGGQLYVEFPRGLSGDMPCLTP